MRFCLIFPLTTKEKRRGRERGRSTTAFSFLFIPIKQKKGEKKREGDFAVFRAAF